MTRAFVRYLLASTALMTVQCNHAPQDSDVNVVGGREDDVAFPSAVGLISFVGSEAAGTCTGTVVRDDLVMTAAHCLVNPDGQRVTSVRVFRNSRDLAGPSANAQASVMSSQFVIPPKYDHKALEQENYAIKYYTDIAFVRFPRGSLSGYPAARIAQTAPKPGDPVTMVGYGNDQLGAAASNPDLKRLIGRNQIGKVDWPLHGERIVIYSRPSYDANGKVVSMPAIIHRGDSGGPLFDAQGAVIGVASTGTAFLYEGRPMDFAGDYVNLTSTLVAAFVQEQLRSAPEPAAAEQQVAGIASGDGSAITAPVQRPVVTAPGNAFAPSPSIAPRPVATAPSIPTQAIAPKPMATAPAPSPKPVATAPASGDIWRDSYNGNTFPYCVSRASDPDGDGWGWENKASCKVR